MFPFPIESALFDETFVPPCVSCPAVLDGSEEALLPNCEDVSHPDKGADHAAAGRRRQGHARLQEGRTRDRGGEAVPEPRAQPRVQ